jgi:hypothetical protein
MSGPFEWRLQDIERKADEALQIKYEMATLRSDVGRLEHTVGKFRSEADGLLVELQIM